MNRRRALQRLMGLFGAAGLAATFGPRAALAISRAFASGERPARKLAVVGGGMGGLAAAWLCDPSWSVDLFEARPKLGGHCDSEVVDFAGQPLHVDLGAQFFHPDTHPLYVCLLEELGLFRADDHVHDQSLEAKASLTFFSVPDGHIDFVSSHPINHLIRAIDFAIYTGNARKSALKHLPFELTVDEWAHGLHLPSDFRGRIVVPMISAMIGTTIENTRRSSVRSILETFALSFPKNLLRGATTWNSRIGLQGNLMTMVGRCGNLSAHVSSEVSKIEKTAEGWFVEVAGERHGPYEAVVLNAPPSAAAKLIAGLAWGAEPAALLSRFETFESRLVIHSDPVYMPRSRKDWSVYNAGTTNGSCEGSVWLGGIHERISGRSVDVFKSWAMRRDREPKDLLFERRFRHPLITPDSIAAARALKKWQGTDGLWFSGQYTTGMDLQETALYSATKVAERLAPESANLSALRQRLARKGLASLSYDL